MSLAKIEEFRAGLRLLVPSAPDFVGDANTELTGGEATTVDQTVITIIEGFADDLGVFGNELADLRIDLTGTQNDLSDTNESKTDILNGNATNLSVTNLYGTANNLTITNSSANNLSVPTQANTTSNTQVASTEFVKNVTANLTISNTSVRFLSLGVGVAPTSNTGEIIATDNITAYYSDQRLKENIRPIDNAIDKILKLNGVYYTQNKFAETFGYTNYDEQVGVLAQEVQQVMPHVVKAAPFDRGENGTSLTGENYLTVQYEKLVPLLIQAVKEQQKQIENLNKQVEEITRLM